MEGQTFKNVMLASPSYDGRIEQAVLDAIIRATKDPNVKNYIQTVNCSSLTRVFNTLWATALTDKKHKGLTHFAMIHADIAPEPWWLDKMLAIMEKTGADVLSAIVPQKTTQGLTSTAFDLETKTGDDPFDHWKIQRLTMQQAFKEFEPTFTRPDILLNTGLMLVDMRKDWVREIVFRFENDILEQPDGKLRPVEISEDWYFSREAKKRGAKLFATREVKVYHLGATAFPNHYAWGTVEVDPIK